MLSARAALFVLLAFQLIVGLPLQTAQAAAVGAAPVHMPVATRAHAIAATPRVTTAATPSAASPALSATAPDCPMHDATHGVTLADGANKHAPTGHHDCCHVSACQCHCVHTPVAVDLPPFADVATSVAVPSLSNAQFVAPRIDEFLRPPIA